MPAQSDRRPLINNTLVCIVLASYLVAGQLEIDVVWSLLGAEGKEIQRRRQEVIGGNHHIFEGVSR